jgi:hypothetical protein
MECINHVDACNDPATLRCGVTALQKRLRLRLSIHYRAEHYSEGKIVELNTAIF